MIIYKKETGEAFDLPGEFNLEVEYNNPIFSDNGSQSIPVTLPMTKKNRRMLGYPDVMESSKNPEFKTEVIVDTEGMQKVGTMVLLDSKGSVSIGFDDGDAYSRIKKLKLKDLKNLPFYRGTSLSSERNKAYLEHQVDLLIAKFKDMMESDVQTDPDYRLFPVLLDRSEVDNKVYYKTINKFTLDRANSKVVLKGAANYTEDTVENGAVSQMRYVKGYSLAPFLLIHRVIDFAMSEIGYTIKENIFKTDKSLSRLCVLHNCMDPICKGYLDFKDLMPDCTIAELIDTLKARFGAIFYFDSNEKTVTIRLIKDTINSTEKVDITSYVKTVDTTFEQPKHLKLTCNRDFESAQTQCDTREEFANTHANMCNHRSEGNSFIKVNGLNLRLRKATGMFYKTKGRTPDSSNGSTIAYYPISSNAFDYDRNEKELESIDFSASDQTAQSFIEDKLLLNAPETHPTGVEYYMLLPYYQCGTKHVITAYTGTENSVDATNTPLSLVYYGGVGRFRIEEGRYPPTYKYHYATNQYYDNRGEGQVGGVVEAGLHYAGEHGLFIKYWTEFDAMLRYSFHLHECKAVIPFNAFRNIKMENPVILNGQSCLIESIKQNNDTYEVNLRTIKPKQSSNYNLINDQAQRLREVEDEQKYYWLIDPVKNNAQIDGQLGPIKAEYHYNHSKYHDPNYPHNPHVPSGTPSPNPYPTFSLNDIRYSISPVPEVNPDLFDTFAPPTDKDEKILQEREYNISYISYWHEGSQKNYCLNHNFDRFKCSLGFWATKIKDYIP